MLGRTRCLLSRFPLRPSCFRPALLLGIFFPVGAQVAGIEKASASLNSSVASVGAQKPPTHEGFLAPFASFFLAAGFVMSWLAVRSRWFGRKLILILPLAMYGVMTVATQVESLFFLRVKMRVALIWRLFAQGAITTASFVPGVVALMVKLRWPRDVVTVGPGFLAEEQPQALSTALLEFLSTSLPHN